VEREAGATGAPFGHTIGQLSDGSDGGIQFFGELC
jgi:hypothetical protein